MYREEKVKVQEWEEECRVERKKLPRPKPHPLLVATGDITVCINTHMIIFVSGGEICTDDCQENQIKV